MGHIYVFDNNTGKDVPKTINRTPVELLFGDSISKVKSNIEGDADLFCIFTNINNEDIIVQSEIDKRFMIDILKFGKLDHKISVKESSIWYSNNTLRNIIITSNVNIDSDQLSLLLEAYISKVKDFINTAPKQEKRSMYIVSNIRNSREIMRTPDLDEAVKICDTNPCSVVTTRDKEVVYKSGFGKVAVPTKDNHTIQYKAKVRKMNKEFGVKIQ